MQKKGQGQWTQNHHIPVYYGLLPIASKWCRILFIHSITSISFKQTLIVAVSFFIILKTKPNSHSWLYIHTYHMYTSLTGWWYTCPSEKYEFISWDDENPNWMESHKIHVPNHQLMDSIPMIFQRILWRLHPHVLKYIHCSKSPFLFHRIP